MAIDGVLKIDPVVNRMALRDPILVTPVSTVPTTVPFMVPPVAPLLSQLVRAVLEYDIVVISAASYHTQGDLLVGNDTGSAMFVYGII
jgi:hypothetical protein